MYKQTLCFIRRKDELLMLNREYKPTQGLWNGVGGKMEADETPLKCVIREVKEETDIDISNYKIIDQGIISWEVDNSFTGGSYIYLVNIEENYEYQTPKKIDEGILDWKKISWLLEDQNYGVGEMVPHFLPNILNDDKKYNHFHVIKDAKLTKYEMKELELLI
ncbi:8-oxo-dGTP diphosphatase [Bacillus cereus group sp. N21]|uniref:NUDIX hydrolase n=1 Tax=Bacillus cereus group sp. N21 TaxID=2794591 RepID=UPI0018F45692|nr:8-oxo-dGTP diphosphatase [Bacillus cereus group sp. N21]MBJ8032008.1 8-oxo-dGTP diphosphatase [Bacillus cereus group sp. N21]